MTTRDASPQTYARLGGVLYLMCIVVPLFGEIFVRGRLIVRGDAAATASNILASETLFRAGLAGDALTWLCDIGLAVILYVLLKPVNPNVALLAAFLRATFVAVYAVAKLFLLAALVILGGDDFLKAFEPQKLQALSYLSLRLHGYAFGFSLIFFGVHCSVIGYLIYKSGYMPRIIGVLLIIAGPGYLINSFAQILDPALGSSLFPWIVLPAFPAELGLCLWLLVKGVNVQKWEEAAHA